MSNVPQNGKKTGIIIAVSIFAVIAIAGIIAGIVYAVNEKKASAPPDPADAPPGDPADAPPAPPGDPADAPLKLGLWI